MIPRVELLRAKCLERAPWVLGALIAVSVGVLANAVQASFETWLSGGSVPRRVLAFRGVSFAVFAFAVWGLYRLRGFLYAPRTRHMTDVEFPEKREHLTIFLSNLRIDRNRFIEGVPEGVRLTGDLDADLEDLVRWKDQGGIQWPWEMPLRAMRYHVGRLRTVTIVCSEESIQQSQWFVSIVRKYGVLSDVEMWLAVKQRDESVQLVRAALDLSNYRGWSFEKFDDLSRAILHVISFWKGRKAHEGQMMIDFTGGQKVTSVVAAAVTFNRRIKTQYVQTNAPYGVISYDILLGSSETGGLGI